jgi:hypothetical protein
MRYAILDGSIVINVIEADDEFIKSQNLNAIADPEMLASVGDEYVDGEFIHNVVVINELETE